MKKILISACLLGERCRYDGKSKPMEKDLIDKLKREYMLFPVCPEVMGGLSTPRKPCEICGECAVTADGTDCTSEYRKGAETVLKIALENTVDFCILKSKSPSCGNEYVYDGSFSGTLVKGVGITADLLEKSGFVIYNETQTDFIFDKEIE